MIAGRSWYARGVETGRDWQEKAEERIAAAEHAVERRLHALADQLGDPEGTHARADLISERAEQHQERAGRLRRTRGDEGAH